MQDDYQLLTIEAIRQHGPSARTLVLQPAPGQEIVYRAGQYLTLVRAAHGNEVRRS